MIYWAKKKAGYNAEWVIPPGVFYICFIPNVGSFYADKDQRLVKQLEQPAWGTSAAAFIQWCTAVTAWKPYDPDIEVDEGL